MGIQRVPEVPFAQIANSALRDKRLSFKARGVLALVLSNVGEWEATAKWIEDQSIPDGEHAVQTALNELTQLGYRVVTKERDNLGRVHTIATWFHQPEEAIIRRVENPVVGKSDGRKTGPSIEHYPSEHYKEEHQKSLPAPDGANAGTIIADWIDTLNHRPPERVIGQMAREVRKLLEEGFDPAVVSAAVGSVSVKGLHPSTVSSEVNTILNGSNRGKVSGARMYFDAAQTLMQDPWEEPGVIETQAPALPPSTGVVERRGA